MTLSITAAGLARLLARLHPDPEQAAHEYERLRRALVKFFDWRGASVPEECADNALDRLARKLEENTTVQDLSRYAHGIARLVLFERRRQPAWSSIGDTPDLAGPAPPLANPDADRLHDCFDRCLAEVPAASRDMMMRYYDGERHVKITNRQRLAAALGLSHTALRSRVHRLRDRLEECVQGCLAETHAGRSA